MHRDDRASHPMTCGGEFTFEGRFDRPRLESAIEQAYLRNPLFRAIVVRRRNRRWDWTAADSLPHAKWIGSQEPLAYRRAARIDLRSEVGMRVWVQEKVGLSKIIVDFHHACSDGSGALAFVEDILATYASSFANGRKRILGPAKIEPQLLRRRGRFPRIGGGTADRLRSEVADLHELYCFFRHQPQPLLEGRVGLDQVIPAPAPQRLYSRTLDDHFLVELRQSAAASGATVNDLLLRALFLTMHDWNARRMDSPPRDWLRILMPVNLRNARRLEHVSGEPDELRLYRPPSLGHGRRASAARQHSFGNVTTASITHAAACSVQARTPEHPSFWCSTGLFAKSLHGHGCAEQRG